MILCFRTNWPWQTVQTQIRLQSDQGFNVYHSIGIFWAKALWSGQFVSSPEPKAHGELIVYRSIRRPCVRL